MTIQSEIILNKKLNGDVGITQNSVEVFSSINASAVVNTLYLKEGMVGIGVVPTTKLHVQVANTINKQALLIEQLDTTNNPICAEINNDGTNHGLYIHQDGVLGSGRNALSVYSNVANLFASDGLVNFAQMNAGSQRSVLKIINYGTTSVDGGNLIFAEAFEYVGRIKVKGVGSSYTHADILLATGLDDGPAARGLGVYCFNEGNDVTWFSGNPYRNTSDYYIVGRTTGVAFNGAASDDDNAFFSITNTGLVGFGLGATAPTARLHTKVIDAANCVALFVQQFDITNNPVCFNLQNYGTNHGLYIYQHGVLAASKNAFCVYSDIAQINSPLIYFYQDNASSIANILTIVNDGTGQGLYIDQYGDGYAAYINNRGTNKALAITQMGVLAASQYGLQVYSNAVQINSPLVYLQQDNASSTAGILEVDNNGTGHGIYLYQDGNLATGKYALYIDNNGIPVDGASRCIRLDGCTIVSTKSPETDAEVGFIAINIDGTQMAIPYYALS